MTVFADTNVLLYSVSKNPVERMKRDVAIAILSEERCGLSLQVLNEFVWQATHGRHTDPLTFEEAVGFVQSWRRFEVQPLDEGLFDEACALVRRTNYSWWDCTIVAAAIRLGCDTLATEDMQHGRVIDGVRISNPFRDAG